MTQTQWFAECLDCERPHTFIRKPLDDHCIGCGGRLVAVGGVIDGQRVTVRLSAAMFQRPTLNATISVPADQVMPATIEADVAENIAEIVRQHTGLDLRITVETPSE